MFEFNIFLFLENFDVNDDLCGVVDEYDVQIARMPFQQELIGRQPICVYELSCIP